MPQTPLTTAQVDDLLFESEGRPTLYNGRDPDPLNLAHSLARHYLVTNSEMQRRVDAKGHGQIALITAFITRKDMVAAAVLVLNSPVGIWARSQLFDTPASLARPRGSHTGMRAVIEYHGNWECRVRYAGGEGTMPVNSFKMLLDRVDERNLKLHVHTFYPTLPMKTVVSNAEVRYQDRKPFSRFP